MSTAETQLFDSDVADATERWEEFESALAEIPEDGQGNEDYEFLSADIPVKSRAVSLRLLHPELYSRLSKAFEDPRISGIARVSSGVRTHAQQAFLYAKFGRGRAANPDSSRADGRRGSNHMIQNSTYTYAGVFEPGAYGYAVDVGFWGEAEWNLLTTVMLENGLRPTAVRPFEPWHFELDPGHASPEFAFPMTGSGIADMQRHLAAQHEHQPSTVRNPGPTDGVFGARTESAVLDWQRLLGLEADGQWGPSTERATADWMRRRTRTVRQGSTGLDVVAIQRNLALRHAELPQEIPDPGLPDGCFGAQTAAATSAWQTKLDIGADGVWGPATWAATDRYDDAMRA